MYTYLGMYVGTVTRMRRKKKEDEFSCWKVSKWRRFVICNLQVGLVYRITKEVVQVYMQSAHCTSYPAIRGPGR